MQGRCDLRYSLLHFASVPAQFCFWCEVRAVVRLQLHAVTSRQQCGPVVLQSLQRFCSKNQAVLTWNGVRETASWHNCLCSLLLKLCFSTLSWQCVHSIISIWHDHLKAAFLSGLFFCPRHCEIDIQLILFSLCSLPCTGEWLDLPISGMLVSSLSYKKTMQWKAHTQFC